MRKRSKSMCVSKVDSSQHFEIEINSDDEDIIKGDISVHASTVETNLKIVKKILQQLPKNDNIPYNERVEQINWEMIEEDESEVSNNIEHFNSLLSNIRNFRTLTEMLKDLEKELFSSLHLPKKSTTFTLFVKDYKDEIMKNMKEDTGSNLKGNFFRRASEMFKQLSEKDKEKYLEKADEMKKNYQNFVAKLNLEVKSTPKAENLKRGRKKREGPLYLFREYKKEKNPDVSAEEVKRKYAELSKKKKLKWILRFLNVTKGDKLNLEQYKLAKSKLTKEEMNLIDEYEGRPMKMSAYNYFLQQFFSSHKNLTGKYKLNDAVSEWKSLSKEDKSVYEEAAKQMKKDYSNKFCEFMKSLEPQRMAFEAECELGKKYKTSEKINSNDVVSIGKEKKTEKQQDSIAISSNEEDSETNKVEKKKRRKKPKELHISKDILTGESAKKKKKKKSEKECEVVSSPVVDNSEQAENTFNIIFNSPSPEKIKDYNGAMMAESESVSKKKKRKKDRISESGSYQVSFNDSLSRKKQKNHKFENFEIGATS